MEYRTTNIQTNGTFSPTDKPVSHTFCVAGLLDVEPGGDLTFANVLNLPILTEMWPGDATRRLFSEYFAELLVGEDYVYVQSDVVWEHMREELLRLCSYPVRQNLGSYWVSAFVIDLPRLRTYSDGVPVHDPLHDPAVDGYFAGDGCEDDDEADTLNSELLLTEEYVEPLAPALDSVSNGLSPRRPVRISLPLAVHKPIERKE